MIELNTISIWTIFLIILSGILFMKLQNKKTYEHFPSRLRYSEKLRKNPKLLIPKIGNQMKEDIKFKSLPDDYDYLYDYERNFEINKVYGDYPTRLEGYKKYLLSNKNSFHNLEDKDVDNLIKLLNNGEIRESDISQDFVYKKDFRAQNN